MSGYIKLADAQTVYRAARNAAFRDELRGHLFENAPASTAVYAAIASHLYIIGAIDKLGLAEVWIASASLSERAALLTRLFERVAP